MLGPRVDERAREFCLAAKVTVTMFPVRDKTEPVVQAMLAKVQPVSPVSVTLYVPAFRLSKSFLSDSRLSLR